jgi:hypothetical protein
LRTASPAARTRWRQAHRGRARAKGIAVLRFDFTGLGSSEGDFANRRSPRTSPISCARPIICVDAQGAGDPDRP